VAVAAWPATIRAVDLEEGKTRWEADLPSDVLEWKVSLWEGRFIAAGDAASPSVHSVMVLFEPDGLRRQMLRTGRNATGGGWHVDEQGIVFASADNLTAWHPLEERQSTHEAKKRSKRPN
jgi:hypothetical protein